MMWQTLAVVIGLGGFGWMAGLVGYIGWHELRHRSWGRRASTWAQVWAGVAL